MTVRTLVLALAATVLATGCIRPHGPEDLRRELTYTTGVRLDRQLGITVTRSGVWLARMGLNIAGEDVPIKGLRRVEVGIYTVEGLRRGFETAGPLRIPELDDWTPVARVNDGGDSALVLVDERRGKMRHMVVIATDDDEWVIVRLRGDLDRIVEDAMRFAFDQADRPDLYERSREERGLDADAAEQATFEPVETGDGVSPLR